MALKASTVYRNDQIRSEAEGMAATGQDKPWKEIRQAWGSSLFLIQRCHLRHSWRRRQGLMPGLRRNC